MSQDHYGEIFSKRLKKLRQERGLTIEEFAKEVGISKSSVGYYENQNRVPDIIVVGRMADVLKVSTDYLIGRSEAQTQDVKLKSICDKIGLSDKSVNMLERLKKEENYCLHIINLLLEQADSDIEDYDLGKPGDKYEGSVLSAICCYLDRSITRHPLLLRGLYSDDAFFRSIDEALYQIYLNKATEALKDFAKSPILKELQ